MKNGPFTKYACAAILALLQVGGSSPLFAAPISPAYFPPQPLDYRTVTLDWTWVQDEWTGDDQKAVEIGESLTSSPNCPPDCYSVLANIYFQYGWNQRRPEYYKKSIAASERYLALTPLYDQRRGEAEHSIAYLKGQLVKLGRR